MGTWMNFALVALLMLVVTNFIFADAEKETTLFTRIGGYSGVDSIVRKFLQYMQTSFHFTKIENVLSSERFYQHLVDYFCGQTGGPTSYLGSSLNFFTDTNLISDADWVLISCIFEETLRGNGIEESDIHLMNDIFLRLRKQEPSFVPAEVEVAEAASDLRLAR